MKYSTRSLACSIIVLCAMCNLSFAHYHPKMGRFMQQDPLGVTPNDDQTINPFDIHKQYNDGTGLFLAMNGNPIVVSDPYGLNVYAIDGTYSVLVLGITNTEAFYLKAAEDKYYWEGPNFGPSGLDSSGIYRGVRKQICDDYCKSVTNCDEPGITVNLVGWSRGAAIALEVAQELYQEGCCCCWGYEEIDYINDYVYMCKQRVFPEINFMGLFDAVDMTITVGWAHTVSPNVKHFAHAMKTEGLKGKQKIFPTIQCGGRYFWRTKDEKGDPTTHSDIGTRRDNNDAYSWIVSEALSAGVQMK